MYPEWDLSRGFLLNVMSIEVAVLVPLRVSGKSMEVI